jgi:hypothetical protein
VGWSSSVAVDGDGLARIAYEGAGALLYASQQPDGSWVIQTVDSDGVAESEPSLALDPLGLAHISYRALTNTALRYAVETSPGVWTVEVVDALGDIGKGSSLKLDAMGLARISYYDCDFNGEQCDGDLKYASEVA